MKYLIIDDIRDFSHLKGTKWFNKKFECGYDPDVDVVVIARTYTAAIDMLLSVSQTWDVVFLDHDLGSLKKTGYDIVKYLELMFFEDFHSLAHIYDLVCVSSNPVGKKNIETTWNKIIEAKNERQKEFF